MMTILDHHISRQLAVPFAIGVSTFAIIMLGDAARQLGSILFGLRVPMPLIAKYLLYHAPHAIVWSMPVGTVVAVAMTMTNLKSHGEVLAMRTGGASVTRICLPMLVIGLLASIGAFALNEYVMPACSRRAQEIFRQMTRTQPVVREQYNVYFKDDRGWMFYVGHMNADNNELERIIVWAEDAAGNISTITAATWAELQGNVWMLKEGSEVLLGEDGRSIKSTQRFGKKTIKLQQALQDYYASTYTPIELSGTQLKDLIRTISGGGRDTHKLQVKLHFKYSIPLACLIFALIAAPIAYRFAHYGTFVGIVIAILIVFLYNGVRSWTLAFGLSGVLHPVVAGWTPDIIFGLLGIFLLWRTR